MSKFVLVSGLPASGKSTLARPLAAELGATYVDKDVLLEQLFAEHGVVSVEQRTSLSRTADAQFRQQALQSSFAVLVSWWCHPRSSRLSGTPFDWLTQAETSVVEVYCQCPPMVAAQRFLARVRHAGHHDERWTEQAWLQYYAEPGTLSPLLPHSHIVCDTTAPVGSAQVNDLAHVVRARLSAGGA